MNAMTFFARTAYLVSDTSCLNDVTVHTWTRIFLRIAVRRFRSTYRERDTRHGDQGRRVIENFSALNWMNGPHANARTDHLCWMILWSSPPPPPLAPFSPPDYSPFCHCLARTPLFQLFQSLRHEIVLSRQTVTMRAWRELQRSDEALENFITRSDEIRGRGGWSNALFFFVLFILSYFYQQLSAGKSSRRPSCNFHFYLGVAARAARSLRASGTLPMTLFFFPSVFNAVYLTAD